MLQPPFFGAFPPGGGDDFNPAEAHLELDIPSGARCPEMAGEKPTQVPLPGGGQFPEEAQVLDELALALAFVISRQTAIGMDQPGFQEGEILFGWG